MLNRLHLGLLTLAACLISSFGFAKKDEDVPKKVAVCHIPDTHYDRPNLLNLSPAAKEHHLKHGDCVCEEGCEGENLGACRDLCANPPPECEQNEECASKVCLEGFCQPPRCDDQVMNGDEEGQDCGGSTCGPCQEPECTTDGDCQNGYVCKDGSCEPPPPECVIDGDCQNGYVCKDGTCEPPPPECVIDGDCQNGYVCKDGTCEPPPPECVIDGDCQNGYVCKDGTCEPPPPECVIDGDCQNGYVCKDGTCEPPPPECVIDGDCQNGYVCNDGTCEPPPPECVIDGDCQNGYVCNDGTCEPPPPECVIDGDCQNGYLCKEGTCEEPECFLNEECTSFICLDGLCQEPKCNDHVQNGNEEGKDCGGDCPNPCAVCGDGKVDEGEECDDGNTSNLDDCLNNCKRSSCSDKISNRDETGIDCGGTECPSCRIGEGCINDLDCLSGVCTNGICAEGPTCHDGKRNGGETDKDCGGPNCLPCSINEKCEVNSDCASNNCHKKRCGPPCYDGLECPKSSQIGTKDASNLVVFGLLMGFLLLLRRRGREIN